MFTIKLKTPTKDTMNINTVFTTRKWQDGQKIHKQRESLVQEIHARPFMQLNESSDVYCFLKLTGEGVSDSELHNLTKFCDTHQLAHPPLNAKHYSASTNDYKFRWERHGEFTTFTVYIPSTDLPFSAALPNNFLDWLSETKGEILVASHVSVRNEADFDAVDDLFTSQYFQQGATIVSCTNDEKAKIFTDHKVHESGLERIFLQSSGISASRLGRTVQRLLDINNYRSMALLGLPQAQFATKKLALLDRSLSESLHQLRTSNQPDKQSIDVKNSIVSESDMLKSLTDLSMRQQRLSAQIQFRLSASNAYFKIVDGRLRDIGECRVPGYQSLDKFLRRRLEPAQRTCEAVNDRLHDLSVRTSHAVDLLRTRLNLLLEKQNHALLESMDKRAKVQTRLQQTVEGLSIAAITYYFVGLVGYMFKSVADILPSVPAGLLTGLSVVPIALGVWMFTRRMKRKILNSK
jgi:uncharacterized membrane-anchored protein